MSDYLIYAVHAAFWGSFGVARLVRRGADRAKTPPAVEPRTEAPLTAPYSRALVGFHMLGFGVMYYGLGLAVIGGRVPELFADQRIAGAFVILTGAGLAGWALVFFRSWKFRAKLESGHELATGGPFALMRNPIYMAINLLALGTALWVPSPIEFAALALIVLGGDLRARSEEKLLLAAFGEHYRVYAEKTKRFVPGFY